MKAVYLEIDKVQNLYSGLGQFCLQLGKSIGQQKPEECEVVFAGSKKIEPVFGASESYRLLKKVNRILPIRIDKKDVWHCMHQDSPYQFPRNGKVVLTIHDLNFLEKYSNKFKLKLRLKLLQNKVNKADVVVSISNYTASVLRENIDLKGKPVKVIYNGCNLPSDVTFTKPPFAPEGQFLFSIGVLQARKNFKVLLPLLQKNLNYSLIIAGHKTLSYYNELMSYAQELGVAKRLIFPGVIDDNSKWWLYKNCQAFVFPSLSEGFGLPVIEAMSFGKPVVLSKATCLPEIGGANAFYWDSFAPDHMSEVLQNAIQNTDAQKNTAWAKQFSWQQAAHQYWETYQSLV